MNQRGDWTCVRSNRSGKYFAAVLACLALLAACVPAVSQDDSSGNPPARIARLSVVKGNVSFLRAGLDQWAQATLNFPVTTGDRLYTDKDGRAELQAGFFALRMSGSSDVTVTNLNDETMQFGLEEGTLRISLYELPSGNAVEVDTPNGAITVQSPGRYRIDTDPEGDRTVVTVNRGSVDVTAEGFSQSVNEGQAFELRGQNPPQATTAPMPPPDGFDEWSEERDRRRESATSAKYVSPGTPGFDDLDEYGHWAVVDEWGPIWFPPVAVGWVPYRFGHWAWIDPWGWTWIEDEPWGFCSFHYGRWVRIGMTWGWLPGPIVVAPVYAPAFVAFLGGPGFSIGVGIDLVGWFPLGPGEPFFPWYHYNPEYLRVVNVTNIRSVTNITDITNITNIRDVHYTYKTVATTAVPKNAFSSGQPVAHQAVKVSPEQIARLPVTPHPAANPTMRAATPGKAVPAPPVRSQRLVAGSEAARPGSPAGNEPRQPASPRTREKPVGRNPGIPSRSESRGLITRIPPPVPRVPFADTRRAMMEHPGRPLEPGQTEDLRVGRPVGPMRDREFPPHPAPVLRERAVPLPVPKPHH